MKKLTVLVAVILITGLLAGCWVLPESKLDRIVADPDKVDLAQYPRLLPNQQQLTITAFYDDGASADVTIDCDYLSSDIEIATVNDEGLIMYVAPEVYNADPTATRNANILVTYTHHNAWTGMRSETCKVEVTVKP